MQIEYKHPNGKRRFREITPQKIYEQPAHSGAPATWILEAEDHADGAIHALQLDQIQRFCPAGEKQRLSCVTVYIMNQAQEFFLMHHKKYNTWLPPGGKIEQGELPHEAAIRETFEETQLPIQLIDPPKTPSNIPAPHGVQSNVVNPKRIDHVDYIYLGYAADEAFALDETEGSAGKWYALAEIEALDTYEEVKAWCRHFAAYAKK